MIQRWSSPSILSRPRWTRNCLHHTFNLNHTFNRARPRSPPLPLGHRKSVELDSQGCWLSAFRIGNSILADCESSSTKSGPNVKLEISCVSRIFFFWGASRSFQASRSLLKLGTIQEWLSWDSFFWNLEYLMSSVMLVMVGTYRRWRPPPSSSSIS